MKNGRKLFVCLLGILLIGCTTVSADELNMEIIPSADEEFNVKKEVESVSEGGKVRDKYQKKVEEYEKESKEDSLKTLGNQFASGIMGWDTILKYITYLAKFIGQLGLMLGALVLIYIGYERAVKVFNFSNNPITNVIKGIIVLAGAYFIIRFLYSAFMG